MRHVIIPPGKIFILAKTPRQCGQHQLLQYINKNADAISSGF